MKEILDQITSPSWWFGVVVVGLVINLVSAYLKRPVDRALSSTSEWWSARSNKRLQKHQQLVAKLRGDVSRQIYEAQRSVMILGFAIVMLVITSTAALAKGHALITDKLEKALSPSKRSEVPTWLIPSLSVAGYATMAFGFAIAARFLNQSIDLSLALREACLPERKPEANAKIAGSEDLNGKTQAAAVPAVSE